MLSVSLDSGVIWLKLLKLSIDKGMVIFFCFLFTGYFAFVLAFAYLWLWDSAAILLLSSWLRLVGVILLCWFSNYGSNVTYWVVTLYILLDVFFFDTSSFSTCCDDEFLKDTLELLRLFVFWHSSFLLICWISSILFLRRKFEITLYLLPLSYLSRSCCLATWSATPSTEPVAILRILQMSWLKSLVNFCLLHKAGLSVL